MDQITLLNNNNNKKGLIRFDNREIITCFQEDHQIFLDQIFVFAFKNKLNQKNLNFFLFSFSFLKK